MNSSQISFPEDQLTMLKWLFADGFQGLRDRDLASPEQLRQMAGLEDRIRRLQPDEVLELERDERRVLANAVDAGRDQHYEAMRSTRMPGAEATIAALVQRLSS